MTSDSPPKHLDWRYLIVTSIAAFIIFFALDLYSADATILYIIILAPLTVFLMLVALITAKGRRFTTLVMLLVFLGQSWLMQHEWDNIRTEGRWLFRSATYKKKVFSQPAPPAGQLKQIEWDGWGFAGSETNVYLIYDPTENLANQLRQRDSGNFDGIPCPIPRLKRLEPHWYAAHFYTDTAWNACDP